MARFEKLARRLVLSTPEAYKKLTGNLSLLIRLNDYLGITDKINVELLAEYGLKVRPEPGGQVFGLSLLSGDNKQRYQHEEDLYKEALRQLTEMPGQVAVDLLQQMGIKIIGGENLINIERTLALHRLIQFALKDANYSKTGVIMIESTTNNHKITPYDSLPNGKEVFSVPLSLLDTGVTGIPAWPAVIAAAAS